MSTRSSRAPWRPACRAAGSAPDGVVHSADPAAGFGGYRGADLDRAIELSAGIEVAADRRAALQRIMAAAMEELVLVPLYVDQDGYAVERAWSFRPRSDSYVRLTEVAAR